ncbi:Uncharacterised protein [Mycobacteroides abscessus subsp. massiliense]|nr:Uncharacterised protein [Mycobacteroides abscessus subsp. massiliense]SKS88943.1 Uncharacterised protein [Mycobacteroides abscessus subsp. massiliense]SKT43657.1 Uncharacterised protein [Mycobacteroides abscessus subsp. massiliense]SLA22371.1 Uncharacterised protein [Mycobacteroides abscessus subsp. massiliense]
MVQARSGRREFPAALFPQGEHRAAVESQEGEPLRTVGAHRKFVESEGLAVERDRALQIADVQSDVAGDDAGRGGCTHEKPF